MTLEQLIARAREQINARIAQRNSNATELETLRAADDVDTARVDELRGQNASIDAELTTLRTQLEGYEAELRSDQAAARLQAQVEPTGARAAQPEHEARASVTEQRTYSQENDPKGMRFLSDVVGDFLGNRDARERLSAHVNEERTLRAEAVQRAVTTGSAPGTIVPQYLIDLYQSKGRPGRKFADQCRHHDLPETGMTVYIPRQTQVTDVAEQAAELDTVAEDDYEDELIPVRVRTVAGSQTVSRQSSERGLNTEDIVFEDLLKSHATALDSRLINAPEWGLLAVANTITYTDANPTAAEVYRKVLGASANVEDVLQDLDEDDLFTLMRGRRWAWLNGETTDQRPFVQNAGVPTNTFAVNDGTQYAAGVRGFLPNGGRVVTDNNLPKNLGTGTDEDTIVVVAQHEAHLWEDPAAPFYIRAEQVKKLAIDLVLYSYYAACFNRVVDEQGTPKAVHQKITGTGLVAPIF